MKFLTVFSSFLALTLAAPIPEASPSVSTIILAVEKLFPAISGAIADVAGLITATEVTFATITGTSTTQNGLSGSCKPLTVIFARGTADPGNVGFITGPAFYQALQSRIGSAKVAFQGVPYSASVAGFLQGGDPAGGPMMASLVDQAFAKCPSTKVILAGYSQGGQIVHNAAAVMPAATMAKVSGVIIFGDPMDGTAVTNAASKSLIVCHPGDNICDHGDLILLPHLTYAIDAVNAAGWVASQAGM